MTPPDVDYLHGYTDEEQRRLISQSQFLEPWLYRNIDYTGAHRLIEVGAGVGAQLKILLRRFPGLHVTGVDRSEAQLAAARRLLHAEIAAGRADLVHANGASLPFPAAHFDAGYICWVLEHAPEREGLLRDVARVLRPSATLYVTEVFLHSLYIRPWPVAIMRYWDVYSRFQEEIKGDPNIGVELGAALDRTGFSTVEVLPVPITLDRRDRDPTHRERFWTYWQELFHSARPGLEAKGKLEAGLVAAVDREFAALRADREAVFFVAAMQAKAMR